MEQGKIFICDEDSKARAHLESILSARGHAVSGFSSFAQMQKALDERPDVVLLDVAVPGPEGLKSLREIRALRPETVVILMSPFATVRCAVAAMKMGACDYLAKPVQAEELLALVEKEVERLHLLEENRFLKAQIRGRFDPDQIVFKSAVFKRAFELARKVAPSDASVLILGESGTGKELVASTIHFSSHRANERFLTVNCAALSDTLLESQLFGHMKGSFTGAVANQRGLVEEAHKGTLFLDEIGDVSPALQAKLLRVLQGKEFMPVGATRVRHSDVRFVAATNKDLEAEVAAGNFREDLYYRLNVVTVQVPPLRERSEDVPLLAEYFVRKFAPRGGVSLSNEALQALQAYPWPGNVRELENVLEMSVILADNGPITLEHLPVKVAEGRQVQFALPKEQLSMADVERLYIEQVLRETRFHKVKAAQILDISRKTLDRKLQQYGLTKDDLG